MASAGSGSGDLDPINAQRTISTYEGICRDCGRTFDGPNKATDHVENFDHVVEELRRHVVQGR